MAPIGFEAKRHPTYRSQDNRYSAKHPSDEQNDIESHCD